MAEDVAEPGGAVAVKTPAREPEEAGTAERTVKPSPYPREPEREAGTEDPQASGDEEPEADDAAPEATDEEEREARPRRFKLYVTAMSVLALLAVAAVILGAILGSAALKSRRTDSDRAAALASAKQEVINLLTISGQTVDTDVRSLLDGATGQFKSDFAGQQDTFVNVVKQQQVISTGDIKSAGIVSLSGDSAKALVAGHATVKNTQSPQGEERNYRLSVDLRRSGDRWLVAQVEFVP
ncbi:hypothetical protein FPZ12_016765 [Amycolatopsis acidicola]|uniref:Mce-associated membrane protein n=1 Tax=Amycolatopsis acidicola TaxID=2596893 RepID=A0A5N0V231_9PSEU|nr:hypothetical protein [Amycolatopsis acidicola]KAA9160487.1 hypothetical protein FPZ12_016765 [Amycolatopsis acidicola]